MGMSPRLLRPRTTLHPEAAAWRSAVIANSGTVSGSTLSAVDKFCKAIDSAKIRDRFYRLNLMAGSFLGALVPLYRGPAYGGTTYGGTTDTNNGPYISDDYNESVGLSKTVSSSKWLDTGLTPGNLPSNATSHVAVYRGAYSGLNEAFISSRSGADIYELLFSNVSKHIATSGGYTFATPSGADSTATSSGFLVGSRTSSTLLRLYFAATQIAETTTSTTSSGGVMKWYVGGMNNNSNSTAISLLGTGKPIKAYSIGYGLTDAQVTAYTNAMNTFQAALGRA